MNSIVSVILNSCPSGRRVFQDLDHQEKRCRNGFDKLTILSLPKDKFGMTMNRGFTLIELMVVLTVTAVLSTLAIAGFTTYNQVQTLSSATSEVVTMLNLARSRAQSQIKLSALCSSLETFEGYRVDITVPRNYVLYLRCSGVNRQVSEETKILPSDLIFDTSTSFFFPSLTGGVQTAGQIVISGYGRSKTISVNTLGGVSVQ